MDVQQLCDAIMSIWNNISEEYNMETHPISIVGKRVPFTALCNISRKIIIAVNNAASFFRSAFSQGIVAIYH